MRYWLVIAPLLPNLQGNLHVQSTEALAWGHNLAVFKNTAPSRCLGRSSMAVHHPRGWLASPANLRRALAGALLGLESALPPGEL